MNRVISVFGSSAPKEGSPAYVEAYTVGRLLAEAGFTVATGGYSGTMTAASQGAAAANGHVIGVTCTQISEFRRFGPNRWVQEEIRYETLRDRLMHLVMHNDGIIVLPGGIGTLSEMTMAWGLLQVGEMEKRPFSLLGSVWPATIHAFYNPEYVAEHHLALLHFAHTPAEAVAHMGVGNK
jgi:uncharacterized protein (TIGR00730 family)